MINIVNNHAIEIFDSHVHLWGHRYFDHYMEYIKQFGISKIVGIGDRYLKRKFALKGLDNNIVFCICVKIYPMVVIFDNVIFNNVIA